MDHQNLAQLLFWITKHAGLRKVRCTRWSAFLTRGRRKTRARRCWWSCRSWLRRPVDLRAPDTGATIVIQNGDFLGGYSRLLDCPLSDEDGEGGERSKDKCVDEVAKLLCHGAGWQTAANPEAMLDQN